MRAWLAVLLALGAAPTAVPLHAGDPCEGFSWEVGRERALFAGAATALAAGADSGSAPLLLPGQLYALQLGPLAKVSFVAAPGRNAAGENPYAGLAALEIRTPGRYRIAVDAPFWIDVVADGGLMTVQRFQGASGCNAPHKILEYDFPVARRVMLQISGAGRERVRVGITTASGG